MTAAFFGDSATPLFGMLTPPAASDLEHAVLLMSPIGHESIRTHWAMRQLTTALAKKGFTVFRFDWFGSGDSAGTLEDATLARWRADAEGAATEVRDMTGFRKLSVVGLRFGATMALLTAKKLRSRSLVLWEPVVDGADYMRRGHALHAATVADEKRYYAPLGRVAQSVVGRFFRVAKRDRTADADEVVGFAFSRALETEIRALGTGQLSDVPRGGVFVVGASAEPTALVAAMRERDVEVVTRKCGNPGAWDDCERVEDLWLPGDAPRVIADLLAESVAR